jgi:hypothetical protein
MAASQQLPMESRTGRVNQRKSSHILSSLSLEITNLPLFVLARLLFLHTR